MQYRRIHYYVELYTIEVKLKRFNSTPFNELVNSCSTTLMVFCFIHGFICLRYWHGAGTCFMLEQHMKVSAYITDKSAHALTNLKLHFEIV